MICRDLGRLGSGSAFLARPGRATTIRLALPARLTFGLIPLQHGRLHANRLSFDIRQIRDKMSLDLWMFGPVRFADRPARFVLQALRNPPFSGSLILCHITTNPNELGNVTLAPATTSPDAQGLRHPLTR